MTAKRGRKRKHSGLEFYVLDGHELREVPFLEWAEWFEHGELRVVQQTTIGRREVSTVFLGFDASLGGRRAFFETMVFGPGDETMNAGRRATWDEAVKLHAETVAWARSAE